MAEFIVVVDGVVDKSSLKIPFRVSEGESVDWPKSGFDGFAYMLLPVKLLASGTLSIVGD
jgi:hypothetical protein